MINKGIIKYLLTPLLLLIGILGASSCRRFVFGEIVIDEEHNPLIIKKMPTTRAEIYFDSIGGPPVVTDPNLKNPDKDGAFNDWATCLVMIKEGHSHGAGKMHANYVYDRAPWQQEQFVVVRNTPNGPVVEVDKKSTVTYLEKQRNMEGPAYLRVTAGIKNLWGLCFYFFDKNGKLMNDKILDSSKNYQIFFSVSDLDEQNRPYKVMDVRWKGQSGSKKTDWSKPREQWNGIKWPVEEPTEADSFKGKDDFKARQEMTPKVFTYTYRDTWKHENMGDGARNLFNIRLLPPLTKDDLFKANDPNDVDCVGLKGHLSFDFKGDVGLDAFTWPEKLTKDLRQYTRPYYLLPQFCLAVRVMKKNDGNKEVEPLIVREGPETTAREGENPLRCSPYMGPKDETGWTELIRFNIPFRVFTSRFDSDPTGDDPYEPYFWNAAKEIHLSPQEVYEGINNLIVHSDDGVGGNGFGAFFL